MVYKYTSSIERSFDLDRSIEHVQTPDHHHIHLLPVLCFQFVVASWCSRLVLGAVISSNTCREIEAERAVPPPTWSM